MISFCAQPAPLELPHPNKSASALTHNWDSLPLVEVLLDLSETEDYATVRALFEYPLEHCPELLLLKLGQAKVRLAKSISQREDFSNHLPCSRPGVPCMESYVPYCCRCF